ncbi:hypothetical protein [Winogradskya humida]|uniref:Uncharacterized protein n=1 Tax=Winogradskya humida TaxID=113566 RepID=A0ABQ3ZL76_9ACTN|nr:hypothetical protein [Actinoplanes humidus]GIE19318.1 hypothetical protein Ahu01nite_024200 [Actinoplanes humidus]
MGDIDLDRTAELRPPPATHRPRTLLAAATVLTLGTLLGAAATHTWDEWQHERTRNAEISVLVLADTGPQTYEAGVGAIVVNNRVTDAALTRRVTLVNAGPLPVDVHNLRVDRPGLTIRGVEKQRWIKHGETLQADADIRIVCAAGLPLRKLTVHLAVRTDDNQQHTTTATLDATQWNDQARLACNGNLL